MLYKTPKGTLKDNHVIWHEGKYYMLAMYNDNEWRNMWIATSTDGVHWNGVGSALSRPVPAGLGHVANGAVFPDDLARARLDRVGVHPVEADPTGAEVGRSVDDQHPGVDWPGRG